MTEQWGRVPFGERIRLMDVDPDDTGAFASKKEAKAQLKANVKRMAELQELLYAEGKHALLIVLQAMDAGGKDSTIRHVMDGFNPQGCHVVGFKVPTPRERRRISCGAFTPMRRRAGT